MAKALPLLTAGASAVMPAVAAAAPTALATAAPALGGAVGAGTAGLSGLAAPIAQGLGSLGPMGNIAGAAMTGNLTPELIIQQGMKQITSGGGQGGGQQQGQGQQSPDPAQQAMEALLKRRGSYDPNQMQQILANRAKFSR